MIKIYLYSKQLKKLFSMKNKNPDLLIPIEFLISFSLTLLGLSFLGIFINKQKNFIVLMLFFELMLFSLSILSISFSLFWGDPQGQLFCLLIMAIAVSESALGLGILIAIFRITKRVDFDNLSYLRG